MAYQIDQIPLQAEEKFPYFLNAKGGFSPIHHMQQNPIWSTLKNMQPLNDYFPTLRIL